MRRQKGFTLIEMLIVLVIMSTLTVLSTQSIQQAIKNKAKLQRQLDDLSQVRDALKVMERDVNLAFHYSDLETELKEAVKKKRVELAKNGNKQNPPNPPPAGQPPPPPPTTPTYNPNDPNDPLNQKSEDRVDPATHFVGHEEEMYFPTLNASRLNEGTQQADFVKVGYILESCKLPGQDKSSKSCLIRKSSPVVEGDITKQDESVILLTDVTEFKLRFFGKGKQDWVKDWDTVQGDAVTKNRFPDAVEISLAVEKGEADKKKKISMQIVVPIRFSNNTSQDAANAQAEQQGANPQVPGNQTPNTGIPNYGGTPGGGGG